MLAGLEGEPAVITGSFNTKNQPDPVPRTATLAGFIGSLAYLTGTQNFGKMSDLQNISTGSFWTGGPSDDFAVRWTGRILISQAGSTTLYLTSDDGSRLYVDNSLAINNGGTHSAQTVAAAVTLSAGYHDLRLEYFENATSASVKLEYAPVNGARQVIPSSVLVPREASDQQYSELDWLGMARSKANLKRRVCDRV